MIDIEREREREREKQVSCREPDAGLDPGTPGSGPGLKAVLKHGVTQAALVSALFNEQYSTSSHLRCIHLDI